MTIDKRKDQRLKMKAHKKKEISLVDQYLKCILLQQNKRYNLSEHAELRIKGRSDRKKIDYKDQRTSKAWKGCAFFWFKRESLISLNVIKNTARRLL